MKSCPRCHKTYDDSWGVCLECSVPLEDAMAARLADLESQAKKILAELDEIRKGNLLPPASASVRAGAPSEVSSAEPKEDTESRIGKYVLSKIGVMSVVAGVGFFLSYVFKYLSPLSKIGIGYAIAAVMMFLGTKTEKFEKYKWYGRGVICGAWVLTYFTTYAMYHIGATRILSSQLVDLLLLAGVVTAMVVHLIRYKSQGLLILVLFLGYITAGISQSAFFAFCYITILASAAAILLIRMNWHAVAGFSLLGAYITHYLWVRPHELAHPASIEFWISVGFLAVYWSVYNVVGFFLKANNEKEKNGLSAFLLVNSFLFGGMCFLQVRAYMPAWKAPFALSAAGILSILSLLSGYAKEKKEVRTAFVIAALAFASITIRFFAGEGTAYVFWFLEIPILFVAGFYLKDTFYRIAGAGLSVVTLFGMMAQFGIADDKVLLLGKEFPMTLFIYAAGVASFYLVRYAYVVNPWYSEDQEKESRYSNGFTLMATFVFACLAFYEVHSKLVTLTWSIGALFLFLVGFLLRDKIFRYSAIGLILVSLFRILTTDLAGVNTGYRIIVFIGLGLLLLGVSFWYTKMSAVLQSQKAGRSGANILTVLFISAISVSVLAAAYGSPSQFRKEDEAGKKEAVLTASFVAGKKLSAEETGFLRERKFERLENMLRAITLEKDGRNLDLYLRVLDLDIRSGEVYSRLGRYYADQGDKGKATQMYEKGITLDPEIKQWETRAMARSLAKLYKAAGNYKRAAQMYEKYILSHKNVEDLYELAICYDHLGEFDRALEKLNEAVKLDGGGPYVSEISSMRSDLYGKKEMLEAKEVKKAVEGPPQSAD